MKDVEVAAAFVEGRHDAAGTTWSARFVLEDPCPELGGRIVLAAPLAAGETLAGRAASIAAETGDDGRITALVFGDDACRGRAVDASFREPDTRAKASVLALGAPVARGRAVHLVEIDGLVFEPSHALRPHVGFVASRAASSALRAEAERLVGRSRRGGPWHAAYVRGTDVTEAQPLVGARAEHVAGAHDALGTVVFAATTLVLALVVVLRKLRGRARAERADAVLAEEIAALGPRAEPRGLGTDPP